MFRDRFRFTPQYFRMGCLDLPFNYLAGKKPYEYLISVYVLFAVMWLVLYNQALLLEKKTKIAPFTVNPRAPVQVIHRSGAPVLSLLRFRDGFIASQGESKGQ